MTLILFQLQAETINRLLKKQSTRQMKNKRFGGASLTHTAAATPAQAPPTWKRVRVQKEKERRRRGRQTERTGDVSWVSKAAGLSFSVPVGILPSTPEDSGNGMVVDSSTSSKMLSELRSTPAPLPLRDVRNCGEEVSASK
jgi:hypothetical protein